MVRTGMESLAEDDPQMEVIGSFESRDAAMAFLREQTPDLMMIDLSLQQGNGLELIRDIVSRNIPTRMLVVSMHDERLFAERCLRAGAHGYICKTSSWNEIRKAILTVAAGDIAVSPEVSSRLVGKVAGGQNTATSELDALSDREFAIYEAIGRGLTVKEIASQLHLSPKTVESYRDRIRSKLGINSAMELTRHATIWSMQSSILSESEAP
jgi:DNA-binding NarL/FixJ family response regulator